MRLSPYQNLEEYMKDWLGQRVWHTEFKKRGVVVALGTITDMPVVIFEDSPYPCRSSGYVSCTPENLLKLSSKLTIEEMLTHEAECLREYAKGLLNEEEKACLQSG